MQQFGLEGLGKTAFGPRAETRTWLDSGSFDISPGKSHLPEDVTTGGFCANPLNAETLDNQWYHLGLIQNAGSGYRAGATPVDYPYARNRNLNVTQAGGPPLPLMELVWITKGTQQGTGLKMDDLFGWSPAWKSRLCRRRWKRGSTRCSLTRRRSNMQQEWGIWLTQPGPELGQDGVAERQLDTRPLPIGFSQP